MALAIGNYVYTPDEESSEGLGGLFGCMFIFDPAKHAACKAAQEARRAERRSGRQQRREERHAGRESRLSPFLDDQGKPKLPMPLILGGLAVLAIGAIYFLRKKTQ